MARSLTSILVAAQLQCKLVNSFDVNSASIPQGASFSPATAPTSGTSADQADRVWDDQSRALTSGNSETLDLNAFTSNNLGAGNALDALGQSIAFVEICGILITVDPSSTGNLIVGGDGTSHEWTALFASATGSLTVAPGGVLLVYNPKNPAYAVTAITNHYLKLAASGGNVTYAITLLGRSA